ncbi:MATE family efflux transporter [Breznakiella homolactica]|uniref:MATE family efflux transporter n=1 Tax=Breznakiella homolactica TaxID=2798577 RepID=A0A7T7XN38_9SPIR|nr:MATE family efflux transporter [Breznakiella homolactica]QQO09292.1 MATE family efflux transporter [Breznakiella homolactica]
MRIRSLFDDKQFFRSLFTIAVPIMLQNLVNSFVNMVDTVMIGRLGTVEIAAVGLGNQVFFLYNMILFGICSGGAIFTAQYWGKRDIPGIRKNTGLCLLLSIFVAALFTAGAVFAPRQLIGFYSPDPLVIEAGAAYIRALAPSFIPFAISFVFTIILRSIEKVRLAMVATVVSLVINMGLNYLFIFGAGPIPAMGVVGAAIATVIARITEMFILVISSYVRKYHIAGSLRDLLGFNAAFVLRFLKITSPVILNELLWAFGVTLQNVVFARTNTDAIAAFNITSTVSQLTWVVFIGLGNSASVLIGKKIGEGNETAARDYAYRITRFAPLLALGAGFILIPLSRVLPFLFNVNAQVLLNTNAMFIILSCVYPFRAFNMSMIVGVCRAGGDTVFCVIYDILFMWALGLPLAWVAASVFSAPVWIIYLCIIIEDPFKAMLGVWRLRSGKWLRRVID